MSTRGAVSFPDSIHYPSSDGKRMAENTLQARWITVLYGNLEHLFSNDPNVFVAADNLWYPVEGQPDICLAPDVYVVFGRPKGHRSAYLQWHEADIPLTVVFEILSPANDAIEMADKLAFYEEHGVEEYYIYNPNTNRLAIYLRGHSALVRQRPVEGYQSPRMGIRFDLSGPELVVRYPNGEPFLTLSEERNRALKAIHEAAEERAAREAAERSAAEERAAREAAESRLARIIELSRKIRRGEADAAERAEPERLESVSEA